MVLKEILLIPYAIAFYHGLGDQGGGGGRIVLPVGSQLTGRLVVARQAVNLGFNQNQTELGVLVLAVALQVLADLHGLLDQVVQVFREFRGQA